MDQIKTLCNNIRANILNTLDGCQTADTSKFKGVEYIVRGEERYCVCGLVTMLTGEGSKALGVVGVSWGEKLKWNLGLKDSSNMVNKNSGEI